MDKLRECPFCGKSVAEICTCHELEDCANFESCEDEGYYSVVCSVNKGGCGSSGGYARTKAEAVAIWNRRPESENKPLTLEELRERVNKPVWVATMGEWRIVTLAHDGETISLYNVYNCISAKSVLRNDGQIYDHPPKEE